MGLEAVMYVPMSEVYPLGYFLGAVDTKDDGDDGWQQRRGRVAVSFSESDK
jgi:hypothetical protein